MMLSEDRGMDGVDYGTAAGIGDIIVGFGLTIFFGS